jgi:G3E family GTPase
MLVRFPELGHTTRLQIEGADILLLNKIDLIGTTQIEPLQRKLRNINPTAAIVRTERCRIDPELLFGVPQSRQTKAAPPQHEHQPEFESFTFRSDKPFSRDYFQRFADALSSSIIRAKGFVCFVDGAELFNFVTGRWELEPLEAENTELVFIGKNVLSEKEAIVDALKKCEE